MMEDVHGSNSAADTMTGGAQAVWFEGFGGNDTLTGGALNDKLVACTGADTLSGLGGIDTLQEAAGQ